MNQSSTRIQLARMRPSSGLLLLAAVGSVPLLLLEFAASDLPRGDQLFIRSVNVVVLGLFLIDYVSGLLSATSKARFVRNEKLGLLVVIASVVSLVPSVAWLGSLKVLRLAPAVRAGVVLLRLLSAGGVAAREARRTAKKRALATGLAATFLVWISAASAFTIVEDVGVGGRYSSFFDALWWSLTTITTVGYGDIVPVTAIGRLVGGFCMFIGISMFGLITAQLAALLVKDE